MLTIGNLLKKAREHSGKSLDEIAQYLKIKPRYLESIEQNEFSDFASSTYVKGFIRSYATYLGLDAENIVALFRRQIGEEEKPLKEKSLIRNSSSIVISPTNIISGIVILFFVGLFSFLIYQFYTLQQPPLLEITSPQNSVTTVSESSFQIRGVTEANTLVSINSAQIELKEDQTFAYRVELQKGVNTYKIEAWKKNIDGDRAEKIVQITYEPEGSEVAPQTSEIIEPTQVVGQKLSAELKLTGDAWIKVISDNIQKAVGIKGKGFLLSTESTEMYEVTTGRPDVSTITIDGTVKAWRIANGIGYVTCSRSTGTWKCE